MQNTICNDIYALQLRKIMFRTRAMQNTAGDDPKRAIFTSKMHCYVSSTRNYFSKIV